MDARPSLWRILSLERSFGYIRRRGEHGTVHAYHNRRQQKIPSRLPSLRTSFLFGRGNHIQELARNCRRNEARSHPQLSRSPRAHAAYLPEKEGVCTVYCVPEGHCIDVFIELQYIFTFS